MVAADAEEGKEVRKEGGKISKFQILLDDVVSFSPRFLETLRPRQRGYNCQSAAKENINQRSEQVSSAQRTLALSWKGDVQVATKDKERGWGN